MLKVRHSAIKRESDYDEEIGVEGFIYVRATCMIYIPVGRVSIAQQISSPGLWGIDAESSAEYLDLVYDEERETLAAMLAALGATPEPEKLSPEEQASLLRSIETDA